MPSIPEFNAPALDIRPSEIGVESTAAAGRRLGVYGSQIAEADVQTGRAIAGGVKNVGDAAEQYAAHQNISSLARHGADVMAAGTQSLNAYFSGADIPDDPNNPGVKKAALDERLNNPAAAKQWLDSTLEPMLDDYQKGAWTEGGQAYATRFTENLRTHLTTSAIADQSTGAGIAAKDNLQKTADGYATAAFNSPNLHDVAGSMNAFDHAVGAISTSSPTINADGQARIREWAEQEKSKIVTSAVQGAISSGRPYDSITKAYPQYVNPAQNYQFEKQAQFYQKSIQNAEKQQILLNRQIAEQHTDNFISDAFSKYAHPQPDGTIQYDPQYATEVGKVPTLFGADPRAVEKAQHQSALVEASRKEPPLHDDQMAVGLAMKVVTDPRASLSDAKTAVEKLEINKQVIPGTSKNLIALATDLRTLNDPTLKTAMDVAKQKLVLPKVGGIPSDETKYAQFQYDFIHNQYLPAKIAGNLPANALDISDPNSMISQSIRSSTGGPGVTVPAAIRANGGIAPPLPVYTAPAKEPVQQTKSKPPEVGETREYQGQTWRFKGGNNIQANWEPVT